VGTPPPSGPILPEPRNRAVQGGAPVETPQSGVPADLAHPALSTLPFIGPGPVASTLPYTGQDHPAVALAEAAATHPQDLTEQDYLRYRRLGVPDAVIWSYPGRSLVG
jgi:hypothetical protein